MKQDVDSFLEHYGKKGMRWGVRTATSTSTAGKSGKIPPGKALGLLKDKLVKSKKTPDVKKVTPKPEEKKKTTLTDAELRERINRLQMEKQYKQLLAEQSPDKRSKAKKAISEILSNAAKNSSQQVLTTVLTNTGKMIAAGAISKSNPALAKSIFNVKAENPANPGNKEDN